MLKKKIKDLNHEEMLDICVKQKMCYGCPLSIRFKEYTKCIKPNIYFKKEIDERMEEEIEVEEK